MPKTLTVTATHAKQRLGDVLNRVRYGNTRIIIETRGRPSVAVISLADLERLQELESEASAAGGKDKT